MEEFFSVFFTLSAIGSIAAIGVLTFLSKKSEKGHRIDVSVPSGFEAKKVWYPPVEEPPLPSRIEELPSSSKRKLPIGLLVRFPDRPVPAELIELEGEIKPLMVIPDLHRDSSRGTYRMVFQRLPVGEPVPPGVIPLYTIFASRDWEKNGCLDIDVSGQCALLTNMVPENGTAGISVNGVKMAPLETREINIGDWIRIGDSRATDYGQKRYQIDLQLVMD